MAVSAIFWPLIAIFWPLSPAPHLKHRRPKNDGVSKSKSVAAGTPTWTRSAVRYSIGSTGAWDAVSCSCRSGQVLSSEGACPGDGRMGALRLPKIALRLRFKAELSALAGNGKYQRSGESKLSIATRSSWASPMICHQLMCKAS